MTAPRTLTVWMPFHQLRHDCWCHPTMEPGGIVMHRQVIRRPDNQARAFVKLGDGVPA